MADDAQAADIEKLKKRAALMSLLAAVFLTSFKLVIGLYTNSLAILSEALHSGLDLLAAIMTFYAIRISSMPADRRHPYGHGKVGEPVGSRRDHTALRGLYLCRF